MAIIFENIDSGETIAISQEGEGKWFQPKLSAAINSSNLSLNADRGQDYGWRLAPAQQALIEQWEEDPEMIDKVAQFTKVMSDALTHTDFLTYMLYLEGLGKKPEKAGITARRDAQAAYEARVAALRAQEKPEPLAPFSTKSAYDTEAFESFEDYMLSDENGKNGDAAIKEAIEAVDAVAAEPIKVAVDATDAGETTKVAVKTAKKPTKK